MAKKGNNIEVRCNVCGWVVFFNQRSHHSLGDTLKRAWSVGIEHAWDHQGHIVHTTVDGRLRATQQVATMSEERGTVHNTVIVDENVDDDTTWGDVGETMG